jgi:hypothetical protein
LKNSLAELPPKMRRVRMPYKRFSPISVQASKATLEKFVQFSELMLVDIAAAWLKAGVEQSQRVQNLLFSDGVLYSEHSGFLNTSKPSLFTTLEEISTENVMLASPTGFEPVLPP